MLYADDDSKYSRNRHEYCRRRRYMSMTPANGGTYAGQYPCDGWVDNLETTLLTTCLLYTSPSPRDKRQSRMPSSA